MAMLKYGSAAVVKLSITSEKWQENLKAWKVECDKTGCRIKIAKTIIAKYSPEKYLLSHASIIAAVDVDNAQESKGPYKDYLIKPEYSKLINNNGDAWTKKILAACFKTFIGANNYCEHVQIPELSKGKVIDAVLREVPIGEDKDGKELTTYYVDILVATERKYKELVREIESKKLSTLSMGCFVPGTEITMADGTKRNIEDIKSGDMVITHTGRVKPVMHTQKRWHDGLLHAIQVEGDYKTTYVTSEHPFWAFNKEHICACGCGEKIDIRLRGDNVKDNIPVYSRFKQGHYARIINPNKNEYSLNQYRLLKEINPIQEKMSLSWIEAKNLKIGDIVSYPISKVSINSENATIEKARLIGYFLAEGSFVKEIIIEGEENDYGIRCRICGNIYNKISTHLPAHKINQEEYLRLYPDAPINAKINKKLIRTKSRYDELNVEGLTKNHKKIGVEFSLGKHEKDTLNKEICELSAKIFPHATILSYDECVKVIGIEVAQFFEKYGGEYFDGKILPQEVLFWDIAIQRHLVAAWIIGDLNTTGSKNLANQLRFILNRLRVIHNHFKIEKRAYQTDIKKMTADGTIISQHYEGIRSEAYMIQINYQGFNNLEKELNYSFDFKTPSRLNNVSDWARNIIKKNWKNSHTLDSILHPIKSYEEIPYQGWVYNFSVKDDESYIANDIAVHNCKIAFSICSKCGNVAVDDTEICEHVKYEKNNTFYDINGIQRKVAELCGYHEQPDSVTFIDASWVKKPAFTGAVVRNIVNPPEDVMAKIEEANKRKDYIFQEGDFLKAAHRVNAQGEDTDKEPPSPTEGPEKEEEILEKEPAKEELPKEELIEEEPAKEEPLKEPIEKVSPEEPEPSEQNSIKVLKDKIKKKILQELGNEITEEFEEEKDIGPRELETLDESLIQPTASVVLKQVWKSKKLWAKHIGKTTENMDKKSADRLRYGAYILLTNNDSAILSRYGYNRRDFLAVLSYVDNCFKKPLALNIKKAIAILESSKGLNLNDAIYALSKLAGRKLEKNELRKALTWLKLMDSYN